MGCNCHDLGEAFYLEDAPRNFEKRLKEVAVGNWVLLCKCKHCCTYWAVDDDDGRNICAVARIQDPENWEAASEKQRKCLLLEARGGESEEACAWHGCKRNSVNGDGPGNVYCVDHLYQIGWRK